MGRKQYCGALGTIAYLLNCKQQNIESENSTINSISSTPPDTQILIFVLERKNAGAIQLCACA